MPWQSDESPSQVPTVGRSHRNIFTQHLLPFCDTRYSLQYACSPPEVAISVKADPQPGEPRKSRLDPRRRRLPASFDVGTTSTPHSYDIAIAIAIIDHPRRR